MFGLGLLELDNLSCESLAKSHFDGLWIGCNVHAPLGGVNDCIHGLTAPKCKKCGDFAGLLSLEHRCFVDVLAKAWNGLRIHGGAAWARNLFLYSLVYLSGLFVFMVIDQVL